MKSIYEPTGSTARTRSSELSSRLGPVCPVGRLRIPLGGPYRPWATLYRFPDGRLLWHLRLWEGTRAVPRLVSTNVLRQFARINGLPALGRAIDELARRGVG